jgi:D-alanyl-D-alanine carboxypeptidase (penicillin-binding protein 5/6)
MGRALLRDLGLTLVMLWAGVLQAEPLPPPPQLEAASYLLMDYENGNIIVNQNADARIEPASMTKVMLSYIVADKMAQGLIKGSDLVTISEKAWRQGIDSSESRMFLEVGSRVKVEDLLHGVIIQSGNDASVALAEHIGGSEDVFAGIMNQYAQKLGMKHTHFMNAPGMPDPNHYSTAHDLALLGQALIRDFPEHYRIYSQRTFTYHNTTQANRNLLLGIDPSVDGIKTGHTESAGYCLMASAKRDGRRLISVVTKTKSQIYRAQASQALLNYGFNFTENVKILGLKQPAGKIPLWKGEADEIEVGTLEPVSLTLARGAASTLQAVPVINTKAIAPFKAGQVLGSINILMNGQLLSTQPLVALKAAEEGGFFKRLWHMIKLWFS